MTAKDHLIPYIRIASDSQGNMVITISSFLSNRYERLLSTLTELSSKHLFDNANLNDKKKLKQEKPSKLDKGKKTEQKQYSLPE